MSNEKLKPCPFCGRTPKLEGHSGTQYEMVCNCGMAQSCVQICDLMSPMERVNNPFCMVQYSYPVEFVERAEKEIIKNWNKRLTPPIQV